MTLHHHIKGINTKGREEWLGSVQTHLIKEEMTPRKTKEMLGVKDYLAQSVTPHI